jgi:hypothetical protein
MNATNATLVTTSGMDAANVALIFIGLTAFALIAVVCYCRCFRRNTQNDDTYYQ